MVAWSAIMARLYCLDPANMAATLHPEVSKGNSLKNLRKLLLDFEDEDLGCLGVESRRRRERREEGLWRWCLNGVE